MAKIFISHAGIESDFARDVHARLNAEGWGPVFLDVDPEDGLKPGESWEQALANASHQCVAVIVLLSKAWLDSAECRAEYTFARYGNALLGFAGRKAIVPILLEDVDFKVLPPGLASWQALRLDSEDRWFVALQRMLSSLGLSPDSFRYNPRNDPDYHPYKGLQSLSEEDAAIFFGRDVDIARGLVALRTLAEATSTTPLFVILGASGAGKSSFLRAGLLPRLERDDAFWVLPSISPLPGALSAPRQDRRVGLAHALSEAFRKAGKATSASELLARLRNDGLAKVLAALREAMPGHSGVRRTVLLSIDQGEECFASADANSETHELLAIVAAALAADPDLLLAITIRSDNYHALQDAPEFRAMQKQLFDLSAIPVALLKDVIEQPGKTATPKLIVEGALTVELLKDAQGSSDPLPLIAFALQRLSLSYAKENTISLADYEAFGRLGSVIDHAYRELRAAHSLEDNDVARVIVPALARLNDDGAFLRRLSPLNEFNDKSRAIAQVLINGRLLIGNAKPTGETFVEVAHEAVLRNWPLITAALERERPALAAIQGVESAAQRWILADRDPTALEHAGRRLTDAVRVVSKRSDYAARLKAAGNSYLHACRAAQLRQRTLSLGAPALAFAAIVSAYLWFATEPVREHDAMIATAARYHPNAPVLASGTHVFDTGEVFRDCSECPEMVIIPAGGFTMGSPASENKRDDDEGPQHHVDIASFAAGRFPITFDEWDACVAAGGCGLIPPADDNKWGRGRRPVIYVSWRHAEAYAQWLSQRTHQHYRLMSEAEWEYAARAGSTGIAPLLANVNGRTFTPHDRHVDQTLPVGSYTQNAFGLYDMLSNVGQWVEDPYLPDYSHAPSDGSAAHSVDVGLRLSRGGPYSYAPERLRVANRSIRTVQNRGADLGFRVARDIAM